MADHLPDCMLPDGAEPCKGYQELRDEIERLLSNTKVLQEQVVRIQGELDSEITARGKLNEENKKLSLEIERLLAQVEELELAALW